MKKNILIGVIAVIVVIAGIITWSKMPDPGIKKLSNTIFPAIIQGNGQIVWSNSTNDHKRVVVQEYGSQEEFYEILNRASANYSDLSSWEIVEVTDFTDSATVQVIMNYADGYEQSYFLYMKKEDGGWKLDRARIRD